MSGLKLSPLGVFALLSPWFSIPGTGVQGKGFIRWFVEKKEEFARYFADVSLRCFLLALSSWFSLSSLNVVVSTLSSSILKPLF